MSPFSVVDYNISKAGYNQSSLRVPTEDEQSRGKSSGHGLRAGGLQGQEDCWNGQNSANGGKQAHGNIGDAGLKVVLANVLEVKLAVEASEPSCQCDQELCQRRMYVHEEAALDVFGRESTKTAGLGQVSSDSDGI
jgi:hypothetical protein